jgi:hypothetical protein
MLTLSQSWPVGDLSSWLMNPFPHKPVVFKIFFNIWQEILGSFCTFPSLEHKPAYECALLVGLSFISVPLFSMLEIHFSFISSFYFKSSSWFLVLIFSYSVFMWKFGKK